MHELGLVYQVVRTVDDVVKEQALSEVDEIVLEIGEMSDVVPKFIEEAWKATAPTTQYPNAKMTVEVIKAIARCNKCGSENEVRSINITCPVCDSADFTLLSGREFNIKHIVAK